jgi:hypothetical protein
MAISLGDKFPSSVMESLNIDIDAIVENIDIEEVVDNFYKGYEPDWEYDGPSGRSVPMDDPVDDLFERE